MAEARLDRLGARPVQRLLSRPEARAAYARLVERITPRGAAITLGLILLTSFAAGKFEERHRVGMVEAGRASTVRTAAQAWRYDICRTRRGHRRAGCEAHGYYVGAGDWAQHRAWHGLGSFSRWLALAAAIVAGFAWWQQQRRRACAAEFGMDSPEYAELLRRQTTYGDQGGGPTAVSR